LIRRQGFRPEDFTATGAAKRRWPQFFTHDARDFHALGLILSENPAKMAWHR
jgi:hypothetical protein